MQHSTSAATKNDIIFYDGTCGLCHGAVKWVLAHDAAGKFQFSPLQGETVKQRVAGDIRAKLPDSMVVLTDDGRLLTQSSAAEFLAQELRVLWLATLLRITPRGLADFGYSIVARSRYRLFGRETQSCPLLPPELRGRFLP